MRGLDRADDTAVAHHLSSLDYCGYKSFGRFLSFFLLHRWQCPWSMTPLQASDCEAGILRTFGDKMPLSIIWPLMFLDWCNLHSSLWQKLPLLGSHLADCAALDRNLCLWQGHHTLECNFIAVPLNICVSAPVQPLPGWGSKALKL